MALSLIGISVSFPIWLALPVGLLGWVTIKEWNKVAMRRAALVVGGTLAAFWGISILTGGEFIPKLARFGVEGAAVVGPSLSALGGPFLILPALGLALALRRGGASYLGGVFLILTLLQTLGLQVGHLVLGIGSYWILKSFFLWIFPFAILAPLPVAAALDRVLRFRPLPGPLRVLGFAATALVLTADCHDRLFAYFRCPSG